MRIGKPGVVSVILEREERDVLVRVRRGDDGGVVRTSLWKGITRGVLAGVVMVAV